MHKRKRVLSLLLAVIMALAALPLGGATAYAEDTTQSIRLGTNGIPGYKANGYNYIYFGSDSGTPIKWRVLAGKTNTGDAGLFLLSEALFGTGTYGDVYFKQDGSSTVWNGSDAQNWCNTFATGGKLSAGEVSALVSTNKNDAAYDSYGETSLVNDRIFFLSA